MKVRGNNIEVGDWVMVKIVVFEGKYKLVNWWEEEFYVVLDWLNLDILVYVVCKENGEGCKCILYRNFLFFIGIFNLSDSLD